MTFVKWRQHVRLAKALSQIAVGDPMKKVARDSGYRSCSAFSSMFRQALGARPHATCKARTRARPRRPESPCRLAGRHAPSKIG